MQALHYKKLKYFKTTYESLNQKNVGYKSTNNITDLF